MSKRSQWPAASRTWTPSLPRRIAAAGVASRALAQGRHDALDVGAAAAAHRAPGELRADGEQAVVVEEAHEGLRRIVEHAAKRRRPDAGRHRHQVAVAERRAEPGIVDEVADREVEVLALVEQARRHPVEAQDVVRHAQEGRPHHVAPLREKAGEGAAVLEAPAVEADRERHVGWLGRHAEMVEQGDQVGIVALVEDDEADIDRLAAAEPLAPAHRPCRHGRRTGSRARRSRHRARG